MLCFLLIVLLLSRSRYWYGYGPYYGSPFGYGYRPYGYGYNPYWHGRYAYPPYPYGAYPPQGYAPAPQAASQPGSAV